MCIVESLTLWDQLILLLLYRGCVSFFRGLYCHDPIEIRVETGSTSVTQMTH